MRAPDAMTRAVRPPKTSQRDLAADGAPPSAPAARRLPSRAAANSPVVGNPDEETIAGIRIGQLTAISDEGSPLVDFPGNPANGAVAARTTVRLAPHDGGRGVVLMFEDGSLRRPVILGMLEPTPAVVSEEPATPTCDLPPQDAPIALDPQHFTVEADGKRIAITADEQLVLRCGKASITLTKAGKVIVRGAYLLSRSSGVNRIKGGSVQIN